MDHQCVIVWENCCYFFGSTYTMRRIGSNSDCVPTSATKSTEKLFIPWWMTCTYMYVINLSVSVRKQIHWLDLSHSQWIWSIWNEAEVKIFITANAVHQFFISARKVAYLRHRKPHISFAQILKLSFNKIWSGPSSVLKFRFFRYNFHPFRVPYRTSNLTICIDGGCCVFFFLFLFLL